MIESATALDVLGRALGDHAAAVAAGAGSEVDDPVGRLDRGLVVLDDEHRVAEVAQPVQRLDQPLVVALVQADRRRGGVGRQPRHEARALPGYLALFELEGDGFDAVEELAVLALDAALDLAHGADHRGVVLAAKSLRTV